MPPDSSARAATATLPFSLTEQVRRTLRLAVPIMLARAGAVIMIAVDSMMTGHASSEALAHYAISLAPQFVMITFGIGMLVGTIVLVAQADGAGRSAECGAIWRVALAMAAVIGVLTGGFLMTGEELLLLLGQSEEIASGGGYALQMFALSMPAVLMYIATSFFLEGIGRPLPGMFIALAANLLNAGLNWLLIWGHWDLPAMGAAGATLATTITRWIMILALVAYVIKRIDPARFGVRGKIANARETLFKLTKIGAPLAIAIVLESGAFAAVATFAGWLGSVQLAGYQIAMNVNVVLFMLAIGLSNATSVRVANAVGAHDRAGVVRAGWTGVGCIVVLAVFCSFALLSLPDEIAGFYSRDPEVLAIAVPALTIIALLLTTDGAQAVLMGAARGTGDVVVPTAMQAFSFWVVAVPAAYFAGYYFDLGVHGLLGGLCAGLTIATGLLAYRFYRTSQRQVRPL